MDKKHISRRDFMALAGTAVAAALAGPELIGSALANRVVELRTTPAA